VLATAVVVSGTRAYRVDTLAERPWLVSDDPLYLLEYADEVDALPWPEEPVEISFDKTSTVALAPMPERWRRVARRPVASAGGLWRRVRSVGPEPMGDARARCAVMSAASARGHATLLGDGRAARWDDYECASSPRIRD
jgi:hypothetical protein